MVVREAGGSGLRCISKRRLALFSPALPVRTCRFVSSDTAAAAQDLIDLESESSLSAPSASAQLPEFDPLASSRSRTKPLPRSRYQYKSPRYYRGPLHPHQPPPPSDPASREFYPGPFSLPRLQQTYDSTFASDLLSLYYQHYPPGFRPPVQPARLRSWDGTSPYHKGRPLRPPRGGGSLHLLRKRITFRNVPKLTGVTLHTFMKEAATGNRGQVTIGSMVLQAITGERTTTHKTKKSEPGWGLKAGKDASVTCHIKGEGAYHFVSKIVDVVLPRAKDWPGLKSSSGDNNGNITFGLTPAMVALFPEIEINYDSYPPRMIPGCNVTIQTSARHDRDARLLLTALGFPFYGKRVN